MEKANSQVVGIPKHVAVIMDGNGRWAQQHGHERSFGHKAGIEAQLRTLASISVLGNAIGAPTDSRSLLSYSRHEYYRRILCNFIGNMVENGEYLADSGRLGLMVQDVCYQNALRYFGFRV